MLKHRARKHFNDKPIEIRGMDEIVTEEFDASFTLGFRKRRIETYNDLPICKGPTMCIHGVI